MKMFRNLGAYHTPISEWFSIDKFNPQLAVGEYEFKEVTPRFFLTFMNGTEILLTESQYLDMVDGGIITTEFAPFNIKLKVDYNVK